MALYCIAGGAGFVGRRLVARLAGAGNEVVVLSRAPEQARHVQVHPRVRVAGVTYGNGAALATAIRGARGIINLVGILNEPGRDGEGFRRAHVDLTTALIGACKAADVPRLVQISALKAAVDAPSHYLQTKALAEAAVRDSGLQWTILRPSVIFGPGDGFVNRFGSLLSRIPLAFPLAMPDARFAPIHVDDLVSAIVAALDSPVAVGATFELCGAEVVTLREAVEIVCRALGLRRRVLGLSPKLSQLQAAVMDFMPGKPFSTDNFRSLQVDSVCATSGMATLGLAARSFREHAASALAGVSAPTDFDRFRKLAGR